MNAFNHAEFHLTQKSDEIDAEERRLIDEAIAAGKVRKIPTGKSVNEFIWCERVGRLIDKNIKSSKERQKKFNKSWGRRKQKTPQTEFRVKETLRLINEGFSTAQLAEHFGVQKSTVCHYRGILHQRGLLEKCAPGSNTAQSEIDQRRERVLELVLEGHTTKQTAEILGASPAAVEKDRKALVNQGRLNKGPVS